MPPLLPALITCLALLLYIGLSFYVGRMRVRHGVKAPATTGHPEFERAFRVQQNTLEQIVYFLPALWLFALTVSADWAAALGAFWLVGRVIYARGYLAEPTTRGLGFLIGMAASSIMLIGALIAIMLALARASG
jgi:uncharacterized membrane protein YecN with MAPEG domain